MSDLWQIRGSSSHTKQRKPVESPKWRMLRGARMAVTRSFQSHGREVPWGWRMRDAIENKRVRPYLIKNGIVELPPFGTMDIGSTLVAV